MEKCTSARLPLLWNLFCDRRAWRTLLDSHLSDTDGNHDRLSLPLATATLRNGQMVGGVFNLVIVESAGHRHLRSVFSHGTVLARDQRSMVRVLRPRPQNDSPAWPTKSQVSWAALLLFIGWLTFQAAPFGILIFASYAALQCRDDHDDWERLKRVQLATLGTFLLTMLLYIGMTKVIVAFTPVRLTSPVSRAFSLLGGAQFAEYLRLFDPATLLGPFEWWNYPIKVHTLSDSTFFWLTGLSAALSVGILLSALICELADAKNRRVILERYAASLFAIALTAIPVALEGLTGRRRQHVFIAFLPAVALSIAAATRTIGGHYPQLFTKLRPITMTISIAALLFICFGARAGLKRAVVIPHAAAHHFVTLAFSTNSVTEAAQIIARNGNERICRFEPCRGLYGLTPWSVTRSSYGKYLRRVAQDTGARSGLPVQYFSAGEDLPTFDRRKTLIVDWGKLDY